MRKSKKCSVVEQWNIITVNYDPEAPIEEKVDTMAECMNLLAKSILSLEKRFNKFQWEVNEWFAADRDVLSDLVECCANLIEDVNDINDELYYWEDR